jgi:flagellar motor switch protein FliM
MPKQFPPAAELMIARLELMLAEHLVAAVGSTSGRAPDAEMPEITAMRRDGSLISLSPLMRTCRWPCSIWRWTMAAFCPG